jgi:hypothetical protein
MVRSSNMLANKALTTVHGSALSPRPNSPRPIALSAARFVHRNCWPANVLYPAISEGLLQGASVNLQRLPTSAQPRTTSPAGYKPQNKQQHNSTDESVDDQCNDAATQVNVELGQ